ncbi:MAG TPA: hypothetical protein VJ436_12840 [Anaerolineales bacterium]|nr:hypothetical protein [Anaerolineales bacterium]
MKRSKTILLSALVTPLCLMGGVVIAILLGSLVFEGLPGHMRETWRIASAVVVALSGLLAGGALWGLAMVGIHRTGNQRRTVLTSALGFGVTTILVGLVLTRLEILTVEQGSGPQLPIHRIFTLLFAPAAAVIAGVGAGSLGIGFMDRRLATRLALGSALAGGLAFLCVNLTMEALGWVVGAPGAAERATMLTVMFSGNLAAALVGGAVIGAVMTKRKGRGQTMGVNVAAHEF